MDCNATKRTADTPLNILFLVHNGVNTSDIYRDVIDGFCEAGHRPFLFQLAAYKEKWDNAPDETAGYHIADTHAAIVQSFAIANNIDFCFSMWGNGPAYLESHLNRNLFDTLGLPLLMYWLDAPQWAHSGSVMTTPSWLWNSPNRYHWVNNLGTRQEIAGLFGFQNVLDVGHAADPGRFHPHDYPCKDFDIVFGVGADNTEPSDVMLDELERDEPDMNRITRDEAGKIHAGLCDIASPICAHADASTFVDSVIDVHLANRNRPVLEQLQSVTKKNPLLSPSVLALLKDPTRCVEFTMKLRTIHQWERAFTFAGLSRHFRCATFGLSDVFEAWPGDWERLGKLDYDDQARAYSRAHFGLNVMRWQDDVGLNLKPYEITLSGACLLQAYREGIHELFPGDQVVVFDHPAEAKRLVADLLSAPVEIREKADAARQHALEHHTWRHRADEIIGRMRGQSDVEKSELIGAKTQQLVNA